MEEGLLWSTHIGTAGTGGEGLRRPGARREAKPNGGIPTTVLNKTAHDEPSSSL